MIVGSYGKRLPTGVGVIVGSNGQVGTVQPSARFKEAIKPMYKTSEPSGTIAELKAAVAKQQKQIEALTSSVRKVSERVELSAPAPQLTANNN